MKKYFTVELNDGSIWGVPVEMIARNRAAYYADEFDGDVEASLKEDTLPLFEEDDYQIEDWAVNNMNWSDFDGHQFKLKEADKPDFQGAWLCNAKGLQD